MNRRPLSHDARLEALLSQWRHEAAILRRTVRQVPGMRPKSKDDLALWPEWCEVGIGAIPAHRAFRAPSRPR